MNLLIAAPQKMGKSGFFFEMSTRPAIETNSLGDATVPPTIFV